MAQYTIETDKGFTDFLDQFLVAVGLGKRFKTVNFPEADKNSITSFYDYNFYSPFNDLEFMTDTSDWKVVFEDDAYVLPPNVVVPSLALDEPLFPVLDSGRIGGGNLGAMLMAIQHIVEAEGQFVGKGLVFPNKTRMPLFNYFKDIFSRYITEFLSGVQSYGQFTDPVALSSDFEIEFTHIIETTNSRAALGQFVNNDNIIYTDSGRLKIRVNSASFYSFGVAPVVLNDEKLHTTVVKRVGSTITATTDGLAHGSSVTDGGVLTLDVIMRFAAVYTDGILTNLKITDNGTLIVDCPLDEGPSIPYFANRAATLGSELWNNTFTTPNSLTTDLSYSNSAGTVTITDTVGGLSNPFAIFNNVVTDGAKYLVTVTIDTTNSTRGAFLGLANASEVSEERITVTAGVIETITTILEPTGSGNIIFRINGTTVSGDTVVYSDISLQEIPAATPYITKENIADSQTTLYDQVSDGWTGPNVFNFANATVSGAATKRTEDFYFNWSSGASAVVAQAGILTLGDIYRWDLTISEYVQGELAENSSGFTPMGITGNGDYVKDTNSVTSTTFNISRSGTTGEMALKVNSVKRFLEVAT